MASKARKTHIALSAAALLLPLLGLGGWYFISNWLERPAELTEILQNAGYLELTPPSRLFGPGTISTVETLPNGSTRLHLACTMNDEMLTPLWRESLTVDKQFESKLTRGFEAIANALSAVAARATGNRVRRIAISLQDMRIVTMSYEDLIRVRSDYLKGNCEQAVIWNLQAGARVCQTEEVLRADLAYRMSFADGLEASEQADLVKSVTGSLKLDANSTGVDQVSGDDLYFGVRISLKCFQLATGGGKAAIGS